jgi:hypothetical protein
MVARCVPENERGGVGRGQPAKHLAILRSRVFAPRDDSGSLAPEVINSILYEIDLPPGEMFESVTLLPETKKATER